MAARAGPAAADRRRVGVFAALGGPGLGERRGPPAEELAVERTVLRAGRDRADGPQRRARRGHGRAGAGQRRVRAVLRRRGADRPARDARRSGSSSRGSKARPTRSRCSRRPAATIAHEIHVAVETPAADLSFFGLMALLGIYVGVIPVALGMLWLPWIRRIPPGWLRGVMALTVGLLAFLAIDATLEGFELAGEGSQAFGGAALVLVGAAVAFLPLTRGLGVARAAPPRRARGRRVRRPPRAAGGRRDRAAQPRRGRRDRLRLLGRRARAGRVPRRRLRAPQHDRGARDRRAGRALAPDARPARAARH